MLAQKCTGAFIICHNMSIKGARKRPDMRILCRIARGSEASRNPSESLQRRTEAGGIARGSEASRNPSESLQRRTEAGRIARGSEASRNPLESLQRRTEAGGILWAYKQNSLIRAQDSDMDPDSNTLRCPYQV